MRISKWGKNLAVRLPAAVVEALELKAGDEIEIHVADTRELAVARKPGQEELLRRLRAFRGRLPADFKFDRDEASGGQSSDLNEEPPLPTNLAAAIRARFAPLGGVDLPELPREPIREPPDFGACPD